jgi:RNA polymerase sigma factor (sigma-70 family)
MPDCQLLTPLGASPLLPPVPAARFAGGGASAGASASVSALATRGPGWATDLARLYGEHHHWLLGWLRRKLDCADQAADLAQDIFLRLIHARLRGVADPASLREPRAFLATVADRLVANRHRRLSLERAWADALAGLPEAHWPSPEQQAAARQALRRLDTALDTLPERARRAFLLSQFDGLTYAQIAAELAVTERSIKRYMAQAFEACLLAAA